MRLLRCQQHIVESRRGLAMLIGHQLHQQHAVEKVDRCRHAHTSGREPVQRIDFGTLPDRFLLLPAVAGAFGHGAGLA